ncbi:hypothetical protein JCM10908_000947 [Rhodotorula pacifica]|uniref:uncharacterized protein n=1 Tax=Rhodotorula pacifica TaxID=1495444 RepID=UPI00317CE49F
MDVSPRSRRYSRGGYDDDRRERFPPRDDRRRYPDSPDEMRKRRRSISPPGRGGPRRGGGGPRDGPPDDYYHRPPRDGKSHAYGPDGYSDRRPSPDSYGYPPAPGGYHDGYGAAPPPPPRRPVLEPPMNLPYMVTHRYFSDWFHASQSDALSGADFDKALGDAWTKYQGDFLRRELKASWADIRMRAPEWAEEKYGITEERANERKEKRRTAEKETRMRKWAEKAANGDFDDVSFDFDEELARKPRIIPNAAAQAAAAAEAAAKAAASGSENGSDANAAPPKAASPIPTVLKASSPEHVILPARPEIIVCSGVPSTVPTRALIEIFRKFDGFSRLSISDPQPHLGFLRVAWATFASAEAATAALSTIQAAYKAPAPAAAEEKKAEAAPTAGEGPAEATEGGDAAMQAEPEVPAESAPATEEAAAPAAPTEPISPYSVGVYDLTYPGLLFIRLEPIEVRVRAAPACTSVPARIAQDLETALQAVEVLEKQLLPEDADGETASSAQSGSAIIREKRAAWEKEAEERKEKESLDEPAYEKARDAATKRALDLALAYLRDAFDVCFYCCAICDSPEQLSDMCSRHVRRCDITSDPRRQAMEINWVSGFDRRVPLMTDTSTLDLRDFGAESREEEQYRLLAPHVKQEEEGKFRCKECNKLFSARKFVEKHLGLKHPEVLGNRLDEVAIYNNYVLDPCRVPLALFQCENYLPSILNPPPPPPPPRRPPPLAERLGPAPEPKRRRREPPPPVERGPPAPPPKGAALDPRAQRGATAYADLDGPAGAGADIVLPY